MAVDLSNKSVLVIDQGLFTYVAERLARDFGRTMYFSEWRSAFPKLKDASVGEGLPGVERVYDLWDAIDSADLIVFPDTHNADLQQYLRRKGYRVWGAAAAESLELDRVATRQLQKEIGVAAPPSQSVRGVAALRKLLASTQDKWVKVSLFRGDAETFHHLKPFTSEPWLDDLDAKYGPLAESVEFLVEDAVEGVEIAYDCFTVDGKFPQTCLWGIEVKGLGYLGAVVPYTNLPDPIKSVNAAFAPVLARDRCRSAVSFEMRVKDAATPPVVIDPCLRCGSPGTEGWCELWGNLSEVMWEGAGGRVIDPIPAAKFVAIGMMHSDWADTHWCPFDYPAEVARWVKVRNCAVVGGRRYFVPAGQKMAVGAVVGLGDTIEEAVRKVEEVGSQVDGHQIDVHSDALGKALAAVKEAGAAGIDFGG